MKKINGESPLAPLLQRGEQKRVVSPASVQSAAIAFSGRIRSASPTASGHTQAASPFAKGGLRGIRSFAFNRHGGLGGFHQQFGAQSEAVMDEINEALVA